MRTVDHFVKWLLRPAGSLSDHSLAAGVIPLLGLSALLVVAGTMAMPPGYAWQVHSISESAAQGQEGAWLARLAFLSFGSAVLALSLAMRTTWPRTSYWMNLVFAAFMAGAAVFSHAPWMSEVPVDRTEDFLHSVCATGMGFAFCIGVSARLVQRGMSDLTGRAMDAIALLTAIVLPLVLATSTTSGGLMQRVMFAVAYVWFGREALIALRSRRDF